jgi:hypothetical protein
MTGYAVFGSFLSSWKILAGAKLAALTAIGVVISTAVVVLVSLAIGLRKCQQL